MWGERLLPRARFIRPGATTGRWLVSTPVTVTVEGPEAARPALSSDGPRRDREILVALYEATDGPNWSTNTNWLTDLPLEAWYGVATNADGRVTELRLDANNLRGPLLPEVGDLEYLEVLLLRFSHLTGGIPPDLGKLTRLRWLDARRSQLTGPLPPELGDLAQLEVLILKDNQLTGPIPEEFGRLERLEVLDLQEPVVGAARSRPSWAGSAGSRSSTSTTLRCRARSRPNSVTSRTSWCCG